MKRTTAKKRTALLSLTLAIMLTITAFAEYDRLDASSTVLVNSCNVYSHAWFDDSSESGKASTYISTSWYPVRAHAEGYCWNDGLSYVGSADGGTHSGGSVATLNFSGYVGIRLYSDHYAFGNQVESLDIYKGIGYLD